MNHCETCLLVSVSYLTCSEDLEHIIYTDSKAQSVTPSPVKLVFRPLREVCLANETGSRVREVVPLHERTTLVKRLASAVLQFHATPWLYEVHLSNDVLLPGINGSSQREPCVNVSIEGPHDIFQQDLDPPLTTSQPGSHVT